MPEIVESERGEACFCHGGGKCPSEPGAVMREHAIGCRGLIRALFPAYQDRVGHRIQRNALVFARFRVAHAEGSRDPVNIGPREPEQLPLPLAGLDRQPDDVVISCRQMLQQQGFLFCS
jgi:hypothetical protein